MTSPTRWVMVDDTSSDIHYSGPWFQARNVLDNLGNFGAPFEDTLHGVTTNASCSFTFSGSRIIVYGSSQVVTTSNGGFDPSWECFIDGINIGGKSPNFGENNWVFCEDDTLSDGQHTVSLNGTVLNSTETLWFDRFQYIPSQNVSLDNSTIMVTASDPSVELSSGWQDMREIGNLTLQTGANASIDFIGVQVGWYSLIPGDQPGAASSGTYSIDGAAPVTFLLAGHQTGAMEPYNTLFFQTPVLAPGHHHMVVVNGGNSQVTPLSLEYLVIQNATVPKSATSTTSGSAGTGTQTSNVTAGSSSDNRNNKVSIGAVVGGVVGGLIFIGLAAFLFIFLRRRARKSPRKSPPVDLGEDQSEVVQPFNLSPSIPINQSSDGRSSPYFQHQSEGGRILAPFGSSVIRTDSPRTEMSTSSIGQAAAVSSSSTSNLLYQPILSGKVREAEAAHIALPANATSTQFSEGYTSSQLPAPQRVVRSADSGIRIPRVDDGVQELPPEYTLS